MAKATFTYKRLEQTNWKKLEIKSPNTGSDSIEYVWINYDIPTESNDLEDIFEKNQKKEESKQMFLF